MKCLKKLIVLGLVGVVALVTATSSLTAPQVSPLKFVDPLYSVGGPHPTSGLAGFPARDYMTKPYAIMRAPFTGCVPRNRPWGRAPLQAPSLGFGGSRIYLTQTKTGLTTYIAHLGLNSPYGDLFVRPGECFRQGDPIATVWNWPGDPGRSHPHMGWQGGDPLIKLVDRYGNFVIQEGPIWTPIEKVFPRVLLRHEGDKWRVRAGDKRIYQGGEDRARVVYNRQKLARRINLHFKYKFKNSPLVGFGLMYVREFRRQGVDPRIGAAIATCETGAGLKGNGPAINNDFGIFKNGKLRSFSTRKAAIRYLAELLAQKYLDQGRATIVSIGAKYAPRGAKNDPNDKNKNWVNCVTGVYQALNGTSYLR